MLSAVANQEHGGRQSVYATGYLRTNHRTNPHGLDSERPEFSWRLPAAHPGLRQSAFLVQVAPTKTFDEVVWDSGQTASSDPFGAMTAHAWPP